MNESPPQDAKQSVLALALAVYRGQMTEVEAIRILRERERSRLSDG